MNSKGQAVLLINVILGVMFLILLAALLNTYGTLTEGSRLLKIRVHSYQASIQLAQIIQQSFQVAKEDPSCTGSAGLSLKTTSAGSLCLPSGSICVKNQFDFCIATSGGEAMISRYDESLPEPQKDLWAFMDSIQLPDISFFSKAKAQINSSFWLPTAAALAAAPTASIGNLTCPGHEQCTICETGANPMASCFKVRVCTNGGTSCPNEKNHYETVVAIVNRKGP